MIVGALLRVDDYSLLYSCKTAEVNPDDMVIRSFATAGIDSSIFFFIQKDTTESIPCIMYVYI